MTNKRVKIPCGHETGGIPISQTVPDYHPLSWDELKSLIIMVFNDLGTASDVQFRLGQAIPGHVCPHEIDGPVAKKQVELDQTFVEGIRSGELGLAGKIGHIINVYSHR